MMTRTNIKKSVLLNLAAVAALLILGGCGSQGNGLASLDPNSVSIQSTTGLIANCGSATRAIGDGGNGRPMRIFAQTACSGVTLNVSGNTTSADSVILDIDGQSFSMGVDETGHFTGQLSLSATPQSITFTPVSGSITGAPFAFDPTQIVSVF